MKSKNEGFSFKLMETQYRIEWDDEQYILKYGKTTKYYPSIYTLLVEMIDLAPKSQVVGSMHEFKENIESSMMAIKRLCRYIEKNFKPQKPEEDKTDWGKKFHKKNDSAIQRRKQKVKK